MLQLSLYIYWFIYFLHSSFDQENPSPPMQPASGPGNYGGYQQPSYSSNDRNYYAPQPFQPPPPGFFVPSPSPAPFQSQQVTVLYGFVHNCTQTFIYIFTV